MRKKDVVPTHYWGRLSIPIVLWASCLCYPLGFIPSPWSVLGTYGGTLWLSFWLWKQSQVTQFWRAIEYRELFKNIGETHTWSASFLVFYLKTKTFNDACTQFLSCPQAYSFMCIHSAWTSRQAEHVNTCDHDRVSGPQWVTRMQSSASKYLRLFYLEPGSAPCLLDRAWSFWNSRS